MDDKQRITDLERRVRELEAERTSIDLIRTPPVFKSNLPPHTCSQFTTDGRCHCGKRVPKVCV